MCVRNRETENELRLTLAVSKRAEEAHHTEIYGMENEVARVMAERHLLIEKLQRGEVVEEAIRNLYVQMKVSALYLHDI